MFAKLLVPLDRSPLAEQAIGRAAALARQCRAELDLVLVQEPFPQAVPTDPIWSEVDLAVDRKYLEQIASELTSGATLTVTFAILNGFAAEMICTRTAEVHADLIVMTTHGRTGLSRTWLGSVADAVMRRSFIPVLMLRPLATAHDRKALQQPFRQVLVPLDGSAAAADVLEAAVALANANEAGISLLRVVPAVPLMLPLDPTMPYAFAPVIPDESATNTLVADVKEQLEETARRLREQSGLPVDAPVPGSEQTDH
jgi:nucleotide-binding universal stress UspA family protein